jgi:hypothetical protein
MINILIIFLTQYFQGKNVLWLKFPPFNQRIQGSILFSNFFSFHEQNELKKNFWATSSS